MRGWLGTMVVALLLAGCSATEGIETLGDDRYMVTGQGAFGSYGVANNRAQMRAEEFCRSQGLSMEVVDVSHDRAGYRVFARLTFDCV